MPASQEPIIICFYSHKGGVGKTSSVLNIATILTKVLKYKVLAVDADPQCSLSALMLRSKARMANSNVEPDGIDAPNNNEDPAEANDDAIFRYIDEHYENKEKNFDRLNIFEVFKSMCEDEDDDEYTSVPEDDLTAQAIKNTVLETPDETNPNLRLLVGSKQLHKLSTSLSYGTFTAELRRYKGLGAELCNQIRSLAKGNSKGARMQPNDDHDDSELNSEPELAGAGFVADIILIDLNPGSTLLNAALLLGSDYFVVPVMADHFSCQAIVSLSNIIPDWEKAIQDSKNRTPSEASNAKLTFHNLRFPSRQPHFLGLIPQRIKSSKVRGNENHLKIKANDAHQFWLNKIFANLDNEFRTKLSVWNMLPDNFKHYTNNFIPAIWSTIIDNSENRSGSIYDIYHGPKRFGDGHTYLQRALIGYYGTIVALFSNMRPHDVANLNLQSRIDNISPEQYKDKAFFSSIALDLYRTPPARAPKTQSNASGDSYFEPYLNNVTFRKNFLGKLFQYNLSMIKGADKHHILHAFYNKVDHLSATIMMRTKVVLAKLNSINNYVQTKIPEQKLAEVREFLQDLAEADGMIDSNAEDIINQKAAISSLLVNILNDNFTKNEGHPNKPYLLGFHNELQAIYNCLATFQTLVKQQIEQLCQDYELFRPFASAQLDEVAIEIQQSPPMVILQLSDNNYLRVPLDLDFRMNPSAATNFVYVAQSDESYWLTLTENNRETRPQTGNTTQQIALFNHKGGVAKTTTCQNLAYILGLQGLRVMLVDTDTQCNASSLLMGDQLYRKFYEQLSKDRQRETVENINSSQQVTRFRQTYDYLHYILNNPSSDDFFKKNSDAISVFAVPPPYQNVFLVPGSTFRFVDVELRISTMLEKKPTDSTHRAPFNAAANIFRELGRKFGMDIVIFDMCPTISATNALFLMNSDYFIIPTLPDFMSLQGVQSLPNLLRTWANKIYRFQGNSSFQSQLTFPTLLQVLPSRCAVDTKRRNKNGLTTGHSKAIEAIYEYVNERFKIRLFKDRANAPLEINAANTLNAHEYTRALERVCQRVNPGQTKLPVLDGIIDYDSFGAVLQKSGIPLSVLPSIPGQSAESDDTMTDAMKSNIDKARKFLRRYYQLIADIIPTLNSGLRTQPDKSRTELTQLVGVQIYRIQMHAVEFMDKLSLSSDSITSLVPLANKLKKLQVYLSNIKLSDERAPNLSLDAYSEFSSSYLGSAYESLSDKLQTTAERNKNKFLSVLKILILNIAALEYDFHINSAYYIKNKRNYIQNLERFRQAWESLEKILNFDLVLLEDNVDRIDRNEPILPGNDHLTESEAIYGFFDAVIYTRYNLLANTLPLLMVKDLVKLEPSDFTTSFNACANYAAINALCIAYFDSIESLVAMLNIFSKFLNSAIFLFTKNGVVRSDNHESALTHAYFVQHGTQFSIMKFVDNLPAETVLLEKTKLIEFVGKNLQSMQIAQSLPALPRTDFRPETNSQNHLTATASTSNNRHATQSDDEAFDDEPVAVPIKRSKQAVSSSSTTFFSNDKAEETSRAKRPLNTTLNPVPTRRATEKDAVSSTQQTAPKQNDDANNNRDKILSKFKRK